MPVTAPVRLLPSNLTRNQEEECCAVSENHLRVTETSEVRKVTLLALEYPDFFAFAVQHLISLGLDSSQVPSLPFAKLLLELPVTQIFRTLHSNGSGSGNLSILVLSSHGFPFYLD